MENYNHGYPELSKEGQERTQEIIDRFKHELTELTNRTFSDFTRNLGAEIVDDDAWVDIRQKTLDALCGYSEAERRNKQGGTYLGQWWVKIRAKILEENREAIINDIILDKEKEIESLKKTIENIQKYR